MVSINLGKRDFIWITFAVVMAFIALSYAYGSTNPVVMGHSGEEIEGVCLTSGANCDGANAYADSVAGSNAGYNDTFCTWDTDTVCPVVDGERYVMAGLSGGQALCCGAAPLSCTPYAWTTYSTVCYPGCQGAECGYVPGKWRYYQRRILDDCKEELRYVEGAYCTVNCGWCGGDCNAGVCEPHDGK